MNPYRTTSRHSLPRSVWALGFVSLCMDMSSEMIHGLLPVFLVGTLGVSAFALGMIEGEHADVETRDGAADEDNRLSHPAVGEELSELARDAA